MKKATGNLKEVEETKGEHELPMMIMNTKKMIMKNSITMMATKQSLKEEEMIEVKNHSNITKTQKENIKTNQINTKNTMKRATSSNPTFKTRKK